MIISLIKSYLVFLIIGLCMVTLTTARASEVTGSLSSNAGNPTPRAEEITGTVSSDTVRETVSGGSRGSGSRNSTLSLADPQGAVLGATSDTTPGFPNAGSDPQSLTFWSLLYTFMSKHLSF